MQKSSHVLRNLIKEEPKSEQNIVFPNSYALDFPINSYLNKFSSLEKSQNTQDPISESDDSEFQTSKRSSRKNKRKASKSVKSKNSVKNQAAKVKKQDVKHEKLEDSLKDSKKTSIQQLRQDLPFGINNSGPISEATYLKLAKKTKRNPKSRKLKSQVKRLEFETKNQENDELQEKEQLQVNNQPKTGQYHKQEIDYMTSICEFHVVDFKYHYKKEDFKVERDVFFVFVPKRIKQEDRKKDIPKQLILTGEQVCENMELFGQLLKFYRGLLRDLIPIKQ